MSSFLLAFVTTEAATFLIAALLHTGLQVPLGFAVLSEPRIVPATIVEATAGLVLALSAWGLFARRRWAWSMTLAAHILGLAGVFLGMAALAAGRGPRTVSNDVYHRVMVCVLLVGVALLSARRTKTQIRG